MSEEALRLQIQNLKKHNARLKRIAHDARTKLNAALDGTGLFLWQLDIPSGKLVIFNRRWGAMLGFQPKETDANFDCIPMMPPTFYRHSTTTSPVKRLITRLCIA